MKMISWNVNGIRACMKKGFNEYFDYIDADIFSIQETKLQEGQIDFSPSGYYCYWNYAEKKGYSGVCVFTKIEPISVFYGMGISEHDNEGRMITLEFDDFYHITVYTPNSQNKLARIDYRMQWENDFFNYIKKLEYTKPVVICGDLNVAHNEIDIKNPKANVNNAGFSHQEREKFQHLIDNGFVDTYRYIYPEKEGMYSWWSYRFNSREKNAGWRIDYFLVSEVLKYNIKSVDIHTDVMGSDHCPVELCIDL